MRPITRSPFDRLAIILAVLICWFSVLPIRVLAQGPQGQNAVYSSSGSLVASTAFIDASQFTGISVNNVCTVLNYVLNPANGVIPVPASGTVIDARGLNSGNTTMTCTMSPWGSGSSYLNYPSTILLPAGTIIINSTWVLPANTRLIGEGDGINFSSTVLNAPATTIQVISSFSSGNYMIQFGSSSGCCTGISVENLVLDGQGQSVNGIENQYAQDFSYVDHVGLYRIRGTGLLVTGTTANGSGPYSNITFDTGGTTATSSTVCASINGTTSTRGIHQLSCTSEANDAPAAVLLDGSNNSIEDVRIVGFYDGVLIGANANAQGNVLLNIIGDTSHTTSLTPINTVHISNAHTVTDLSIMGATNIGGANTYTIEDDVSGPHLSDTSVGIYALGELVGGVGYSRYTTSPNVPTWAVGSSYPSGTCARGSLYSCTGGSSSCTSGFTTAALWLCGLSTGGPQWIGVQ